MSPPVALEVTSIVDPPFIATARVADPIADELTQVAIAEDLGRWYIEVVAGTPLRPMKDAILESMRSGGRLPEGAKSIRQAADGERGVVIATWSSAGVGTIPGFGSELVEAVAANLTKLAMADGYELHLAVDLRGLRASDPSRTPPPPLPEGLDALWVIKTTIARARGEPMAWWSTGEEWSFSHDWWS